MLHKPLLLTVCAICHVLMAGMGLLAILSVLEAPYLLVALLLGLYLATSYFQVNHYANLLVSKWTPSSASEVLAELNSLKEGHVHLSDWCSELHAGGEQQGKALMKIKKLVTLINKKFTNLFNPAQTTAKERQGIYTVPPQERCSSSLWGLLTASEPSYGLVLLMDFVKEPKGEELNALQEHSTSIKWYHPLRARVCTSSEGAWQILLRPGLEWMALEEEALEVEEEEREES